MAEARKYTKARSIVAWIFGIYAAIVVLCNLPFVKKTFASWAEKALEEQLDTKVKIGSVSLGFLNSLIINDLYVEDQNHKEMLKVARVSAHFNPIKLLTGGKIDISTAQLFGAKANIYKKTPNDKYNYQFVIDAFSSDDKESKPINLRINSLIVRRIDINYDILSEKKIKQFDPNHLKIKKAGFNLSLKQFNPDSINVTLKRFSATELNSGLDIKEIAFALEGNKEHSQVRDFCFRLPVSKVEIASFDLSYPKYQEDHSFTFGETSISAVLCPSEMSFLYPKVKDVDEVITLSSTLSGSNNRLDIKDISIISYDNGINADIVATLSDYMTSQPIASVKIKKLIVTEDKIKKYSNLLTDNTESLQPIFNLGTIRYEGNIDYANENIESEGKITTEAGIIDYTADFNNEKFLSAKIETNDIDIRRILNDDSFGLLNMDADVVVDLSNNRSIPCGNLRGTIKNIEYKGYNYSGINLDALNNATDITLKATSEDENANFNIDATLSNFDSKTKNIVGTFNVKNINPHALHLTDEMTGENYRFNLDVHGNYEDLNHLNGNVTMRDISLTTPNDIMSIDNLTLDATLNGTSNQNLRLNSDFLDAQLAGRFRIDELAADFQNILSYHLPVIVPAKSSTSSSDITYDLTFYDSPIVHHFYSEDYSVEKPIHIAGNLNASEHSMILSLSAPKLTYGTTSFENLIANCSSSNGNMFLTMTGGNSSKESNVSGKIVAIAHNNKVDTDIQLLNKANDVLDLNLFTTTSFTRNNGHIKTNLVTHQSKLMINDDEWSISPAAITYYDNQLECHNFKVSNGNQYLEINGKASENPNDSLVTNLKDIEVAYILDLVNFHSVEFGGKASGRAIINNIFGKPDANANLYVHDFSLEGGLLGDANILAYWDKEREGIMVNAHFMDKFDSRVDLTNVKMPVSGSLDLNGFILPLKKELSLDLLLSDVRTDFLGGFLNGIMSDIDGRLNGSLSVVGPFDDINLIGDVAANVSFRLNATQVPYCISGDTIRLRYHLFDFTDIQIHDKQNNVGVLNGQMTHTNLANFTYDFNADLAGVCAYNETEFNSDKFMAQFWANGDIHIYGSDGHPITIDANVTPCKGSVFAYDSATPDALVSSSFIDFRDVTNGIATPTSSQYIIFGRDSVNHDSLVVDKTDYKYLGDLYMNVNIDLNPNCEIKLRMDNTKDGYISTFGNGTFQAKYYNKGSFQLFGNYNITSGKYRLYLQDLVYRNLDIQPGSKVEFNGNPFDANIHLICKHEINSVPLSDLTTTTAFSSNNKVKVDCFLDITGRLDNMDLNFSFELPNVSEETRQLVRSMINSDEEMNKQMIYLLGFQRFYPNELAQNNIEEYGTQAVNSLLSSTISGQINQVLSDMLGSSSKWNFGTGITTGQNGWQDLDVEGILSGRLLNDRLLINGNFGYRDNSLTNQANFVGDFEVKYRIWENGDFYAKAYNQTNDRYFTKATLNTQGIGVSFQHDFERYTLVDYIKNFFKKSKVESQKSNF